MAAPVIASNNAGTPTGGTGVSSIPCTLTNTPPGGGILLVVASLFSGNGGVAPILSSTGGTGLTITKRFDSIGAATNTVGLLIWTVEYTTPPTALDVNTAGGTNLFGCVDSINITGQAAGAYVDVVSATANTAAAASAITASNLPDTTDASDLVVGICTRNATAGTFSQSGAWAILAKLDEGNTTGQTLIIVDQAPGSAGVFDPAFTLTGGTDDLIAAAIAIKGTAGGDTTPPTLTSPTGSATSPVAATVGVTTDEANGTLYCVVTTSATQPTIAQIKAGQDHTGAAAVYGSSQVISSTGAKTFNATGLSPNTSYYAHFVHTDAAANDSTRSSSAVFKSYQRLACASDVSAGSWTPSTGATLFGVLDEYPASDADYVSTVTALDTFTVAAAAGDDPAVSSGYSVHYRLIGDGVSGVTVELLQGATTIASWTHDPAPTSWTQYDQTLSGAQADSITDHTALRFRFTEV